MVMLLLTGNPPAFFHQLIRFDHWLFQKINQEWINPVFDLVFTFMRQAELWIPFYLFLLVLALVNFGKKARWWTGSLIMTAIISDLCSSTIIKNINYRLRPCRNHALTEQLRVVVR